MITFARRFTVVLALLSLTLTPAVLAAQASGIDVDITVIGPEDVSGLAAGDPCDVLSPDGNELELRISSAEDFEDLVDETVEGEVVEVDGEFRCVYVFAESIDRAGLYVVSVVDEATSEDEYFEVIDRDDLDGEELVIDLSAEQAAAAATPVGVLPSDATPIASNPDVASDQFAIDLRAHSIELFTWLNDEECSLAFKGYQMHPSVQLLDQDGNLAAEIPVWEVIGKVTLVALTDEELEQREEDYRRNGWDIDDMNTYAPRLCQVIVPVTDIEPGSYTMIVDPFIDQQIDVTLGGSVSIDLELDENDSLPSIQERPSGAIPGTDLYRIAGTFTLTGTNGEEYFDLGIGCEGQGGYSDVFPGAQVRIEDETGTILATAELTDQFTVDDECDFTFTADVPEAKFYSLSFGRRTELVYSFTELEEMEWHVDLVLGN